MSLYIARYVEEARTMRRDKAEEERPRAEEKLALGGAWESQGRAVQESSF